MSTLPEINRCRCGCNTPLPVIQGKRRILCEKFFASLPADIRADITSPASDVPTRRAAIRRALDLADRHAGSRAVDQLSLPL